VRRTEVSGETVGVVFEPDEGSNHFAVVLGGSGGGIPENLARRLAEGGVSAFALGYFGAAGLPPHLVEIPIELLERGIELFRERFAGGEDIGLVGISKGAELALTLAAELGDAIGPVVAIAPSNVVWYGLNFSDPTAATRSSWTMRGAPLPFLRRSDVMPVFTDAGMRTDVCYALSDHDPEAVNAAQIRLEQARGPVLLLAGADDHMWPSALMADQIVRRMHDHGRGEDVTNVTYGGAGHAFLLREFFTSPPPFDFGGTAESDSAAATDGWARIAAFLQSSRQ
jgi:uncharacterized protein